MHIESRQDGERAFDATLTLHRGPFRPTLHARCAPCALIYGHALALRAKGARPPGAA